jgi:hypothetical protein
MRIDMHAHYVPPKAIEAIERDATSYGIHLEAAANGARCACFNYVSVVSASWTSQASRPTTRCSQRIVDTRVRDAMTPSVSQELWAQKGSRWRSFNIAQRSPVPKITRWERHGLTIFRFRNCHRVWLARYFGRF